MTRAIKVNRNTTLVEPVETTAFINTSNISRRNLPRALKANLNSSKQKIIQMIIKNNTPAAAVIPLIESENEI